MSDYISKSALIEEIERQKSLLDKSYDWSYYTTLEIANMFCEIINNQPSIDEKEIIRKTVERIVERLEESQRNETTFSASYPFESKISDEGIGYIRAIHIVKEEGGIE